MWQALKVTTPRQRAALVLRYYDDLTIDQIADVMQTRTVTVKSLIHRGLKKLEPTAQTERERRSSSLSCWLLASLRATYLSDGRQKQRKDGDCQL